MASIKRLSRKLYTNGEKSSPVLADVINKNATVILETLSFPPPFSSKMKLPKWDKLMSQEELIEIGSPFEYEERLGFKGVKIVPYNEATDLNSLGLSDIMWKRPEAKLFNKIEWLSAFEEAIESSWDTSKFNLILHSSGYDSRLISHFLRKCYEKKPGSIFFACREPEGEQFKKIMKLQGWDESQFGVYDMYTNPYNLLFDFKTAWKGLNGSRLYPYSTCCAAKCIEYFQILEKIPMDMNNVVLWTGMDMNAMFMSQEPLDPTIYHMYHGHHPHHLDITCPIANAPIWSSQSLRAIFSKQCSDEVYLKSNNDREICHELMKKDMLKILDPKLAEIEKATLDWRMPILHSEYEHMVKDFKASYYYNNIDNKVPIPEDFRNSNDAWPTRRTTNKPDYSIKCKFMKAWTFASLIDHLVEQGVKIDSDLPKGMWQ